MTLWYAFRDNAAPILKTQWAAYEDDIMMLIVDAGDDDTDIILTLICHCRRVIERYGYSGSQSSLCTISRRAISRISSRISPSCSFMIACHQSTSCLYRNHRQQRFETSLKRNFDTVSSRAFLALEAAHYPECEIIWWPLCQQPIPGTWNYYMRRLDNAHFISSDKLRNGVAGRGTNGCSYTARSENAMMILMKMVCDASTK